MASGSLAQLAADRSACIDFQVLNALTYLLLRKKWFGDVNQVFGTIDRFAAFGERPVTVGEVQRAGSMHGQNLFSWWDCILLASVLELGCSHFLSEDLQNGKSSMAWPSSILSFTCQLRSFRINHGQSWAFPAALSGFPTWASPPSSTR
jgi:predicted nucleic acid-binding protein